jgi:hypothetical protein
MEAPLFFVVIAIIMRQNYCAATNTKYKYLAVMNKYYKRNTKVWYFDESIYL